MYYLIGSLRSFKMSLLHKLSISTVIIIEAKKSNLGRILGIELRSTRAEIKSSSKKIKRSHDT